MPAPILFKFDAPLAATLAELAVAGDDSKADTLRRAIALLKVAQDAQARGAEVLVRTQGDGNVHDSIIAMSPRETRASVQASAGTAIALDQVAQGIGPAPRELPPEAKARLTLAYVVLGGVAALLALSAMLLLFVPAERVAQADRIFEFARTFGPPIVTLVLGFYFRSTVAE